jgi:hypothetical protein
MFHNKYLKSNQLTVRDSFSPLSVPDAVAGLKSSISSTVIHGTADPDVSTWNDLTGNNNHISASGAVNEPEEIVGGLNGKNTIRFDGNDHHLFRSTFTGGAIAQPNTIFTVYKPISLVVGGFNWDGFTNRHAMNVSSTVSRLFAGVFGDIGLALALEFAVYRCEYNGASSKVFKNGVQLGSTVNVGSDSMNGLTLGDQKALTLPTQVEFAEFWVFSRLLDAGEVTNLDNYFQAEWFS